MKYRVTLAFLSVTGSSKIGIHIVEAIGPAAAVREAMTITEIENHVINYQGSPVVEPLDAAPPVPELNEGDTVSVPQDPIVGRIRRYKYNDNYVDILGLNGKTTRVSVKKLEEATGKKLTPRPPVITEEVIAVYPNGQQYTQRQPIQSSQYGVENLIQIRVTKSDGKIISKEFV